MAGKDTGIKNSSSTKVKTSITTSHSASKSTSVKKSNSTPTKSSSKPSYSTSKNINDKKPNSIATKTNPKVSSTVSKSVKVKNSNSTNARTKTKSSSSAGKNAFNPSNPEWNKKTLSIASAIIVGVVGFFIGFVFVLRVCLGFDLPTIDALLHREAVVVNPYKNTTQVGYSFEDLGTTQRYKPVKEVMDGGLESGYPTYGYTKNLTDAQKTAIIRENNTLCARPTANASGVYDKMDKDGYLYLTDNTPVLDNNGNHRRLYQHTGSVGLYLGDVADDEPGVIKRMTFRRRTYSSYYSVTGLYAPAGEVIKVQMSAEDMEATGGIVVHIGQALYNGQANNIWTARAFNRMPVILNTMYVTKDTATLEDGVYTAYIGSFLGGPIYIRDETATFTVTISGAVNYSHFILGVTSEEDFNKYKESSAPYFDLEVWESGVLHSGPKRYAQAFSCQDIYKAAVLWEKISIVSTKVANQGVVFLYDPFVAAGAAVAFPGRRSVNCPMGWMTNSLNYNSFVTSGAWGNMHEYHHNFQTFGVGYTGEVTNNSLNLVAYSLFTKISSARQMGSYGGAGLSGWNCYTSATWALNRVNTGAITGTNGLAVYATLLHNLGQDAFINSARGGNYFNNWANVTHQNFSYYAGLVSAYAGAQTLQENDYPMFVPVSSVYQTGRSYNYDGEKRYIETMQPYVIPAGKSITVDLSKYTVNSANQYVSGSIVLPDGFTYKIKKVDASGINGRLVETAQPDVYTFTPNSELNSGKIYVTLEITKTDGAFEVDDVDLVIEFQQSYELNKAVLERTTYIFDENTMPTSAVTAYENNYSGHKEVVYEDNINTSQNSNTDVWLWEENNPSRPANAPTSVNRKPNSVVEVSGKLYINEEGKYRIVLRGRYNAALYLSFDGGKTYELAATLIKPSGTSQNANFSFADENYYYDFETSKIKTEANGWVYFKSVLVTEPSSFMGIGLAQWKVPQYTTTTEIDSNGNEITHYFNESGQEVSAEEANDVEPREPALSSVTYASAYRSSYEFLKQFESDYFYVREYTHSYSDDDLTILGDTNQILVSCSHSTPLSNNNTYSIDKLFDGNSGTSFLTNVSNISESQPFELVVKLESVISANYLMLYGFHSSRVGVLAMPLTFTLYGSLDGELYFEMLSQTDMEYSTRNLILEFDKMQTFQYYKLVVTKTDNGRFGMNKICFQRMTYDIDISGQKFSPDDAMFTYKGDWDVKAVSSDFGHVYVGNKNATVEFEFTGTRFAILTAKGFNNNYYVYIDGERVESFNVREDDSDYFVHYLSPLLGENGKHKVVIRSRGELVIDAITIY